MLGGLIRNSPNLVIRKEYFDTLRVHKNPKTSVIHHSEMVHIGWGGARGHFVIFGNPARGAGARGYHNLFWNPELENMMPYVSKMTKTLPCRYPDQLA